MIENEINIAKTISTMRKKEELNQSALAQQLGVTKASVSKWETGQSYPDINLLPKIATFFDITIDQLLDYKPQLSKKAIYDLCKELKNDFTTKPFADNIAKCRQISKDYFSCYPLLFQIGALFINYLDKAPGLETKNKIIEEAQKLFIRIKTNSTDIELVKQSLAMEAFCYIMLNKPKDALTLLDKDQLLLISTENLLATAHQMLGQIDEAKNILQINIYQYMLNLFELMNFYLMLSTDNSQQYHETYQRLETIAQIFKLDNLHPAELLKFYLNAAQSYSALGDKDNALSNLKKYVSLATTNLFPLYLHGDDYFYLLDDWFKTFPLGSDLPRDEQSVRQSIINSVKLNPAFSDFAQDNNFIALINKLDTLI